MQRRLTAILLIVVLVASGCAVGVASTSEARRQPAPPSGETFQGAGGGSM